jgi:hypothetical protein
LTVQAAVGDRLVIRRLSAGAPVRDGRIIEVHGDDGAPPYLVEWSDDGKLGLVFPNEEAVIEHFPAAGHDQASK